MNILVINGSPKGKNSNSLKLADAFVGGIKDKRDSQGLETNIEQIDLAKMNISSCRGCFACWKVTPGKCCIDDDMKKIIEQILYADVIIYSFPLYYFNVPGILKNLIDRQLPMVLPFMSEREDGVGSGSHDSRYDMSGKRYVLISTCGFYSAEGNYDSVRSMFDHICGKDNYETVFCGQGELFAVKELEARTGQYLETAKNAGSEYAEKEISPETREKLKKLLFPREIFEKMADASWGISRTSDSGNTGEKEEESLIFTRQMAALYNPASYDGKDRVLEMVYTDLGKTYQILLTGRGSEVYTDASLQTTTRIETPYGVWMQIARGEIRGDEALARQMYRVTGDFSLMINWDRYFGMEESAEEQNVSGKGGTGTGKNMEAKPPVMSTMLVPWIAFWIAVSSHAYTGACISLAICVCWPLLMRKFKFCLYDRLSIACVGALSIFSILTGLSTVAANLGYLLFGLMWTVSCFTGEPLCACYVKYKYGGEDALRNPIFMKTNYILAAGWGILFLCIAGWSWLLDGTEIASWLPVINNVLTGIMGVFTGWFQNWYPAWVAGGKRRKKEGG